MDTHRKFDASFVLAVSENTRGGDGRIRASRYHSGTCLHCRVSADLPPPTRCEPKFDVARFRPNANAAKALTSLASQGGRDIPCIWPAHFRQIHRTGQALRLLLVAKEFPSRRPNWDLSAAGANRPSCHSAPPMCRLQFSEQVPVPQWVCGGSPARMAYRP